MISFEEALRALTDQWRGYGMSIETLIEILRDEIDSLQDLRTPAEITRRKR